MNEREMSIHAARAYLAEARRRRGQRFAWVLLEWAANARRRAESARKNIVQQGDLFA